MSYLICHGRQGEVRDVGPLCRGQNLGNALVADMTVGKNTDSIGTLRGRAEPLREPLIVGYRRAVPKHTAIEINFHIGAGHGCSRERATWEIE